MGLLKAVNKQLAEQRREAISQVGLDPDNPEHVQRFNELNAATQFLSGDRTVESPRTTDPLTQEHTRKLDLLRVATGKNPSAPEGGNKKG